jgi:hypothetical protein
MSMDIRIDGIPIKQPTSFKISRYNLTKSGRVASGDMTMDLIGKKRKFFFEYDVINLEDMEKLLSLIDNDNMFFQINYVENGKSKSATVYVGEISQDRFRTGGLSGWYWKGFNFNLIEQ